MSHDRHHGQSFEPVMSSLDVCGIGSRASWLLVHYTAQCALRSQPKEVKVVSENPGGIARQIFLCERMGTICA